MPVTVLCGAAIISVLVGVLTGIFGVGGGFLITPLLIIVLGIDPTLAVGTGLATILFTSSISMLRRRGSKTIDLKLALNICVGTLAGVAFGKHLMTMLESLPPFMIGTRELPAVEYSLLWAFLGLLIFIAWFLLFDYRRTGGKSSERRVGFLSRLHLPPMVSFPSLDEPRLSLPALTLIGFVIGILTGLMGIGGGVVWLPALVYLIGQHTAKAAGTSLVLVWISSLFGSGLYLKSGNVSLPLAIVMISSGLVGAWFGTHIGLKLSGPKLRLYFVFVVACAVLLVGWKIIAMTFY